MIRCLDPLVSLPAVDPRRAHDFYTRVLGLTPVGEFHDAGFYLFRGTEEVERFIGVHRHEGPLPPPEQQGTWIWLKVDDLAAVRARLEPQGVRFLGEPNDLGPGLEQRFLDSEGNVLRFYASLKEVRRGVDVAATPAKVFEALTTAAMIERWFSVLDDVVLEPRVGGRVTFRDPVFGMVEGQVTAVEPGARLAIEFSRNWPKHLEFTLRATPGGCRLEVWQHGFETIEDRDFGIPGMIEHLEGALRLLAELSKIGFTAAAVASAAEAMRRRD